MGLPSFLAFSFTGVNVCKNGSVLCPILPMVVFMAGEQHIP